MVLLGSFGVCKFMHFCDGVLEFQNMNSAKRLAFKRGFILVCCVYESLVTVLVDEFIWFEKKIAFLNLQSLKQNFYYGDMGAFS